MAESFVKRAPDIAEEILSKVTSTPFAFPESLKSFSRDLLTKEAGSEDEGLVLPKRMSLAELQKMAHEKKVDLPKIEKVSSDEFSNVASDLIKVAKRYEEEDAKEVFTSAAAIVAAKLEKEAVPRKLPGAQVRRSPRKKKTEEGGAWHSVKSMLPFTIAGAKRKAELGQIRAKDPARPEFAAATQAKGIEGDVATAREHLRGKRTIGKAMVSAAPGVAIGAGTSLGVMSLMGGGGKREERIKIIK